MSDETVFMAGGGTGGHVFPMVAVAHALKRLRPNIRPVFIGTERGMETRFVPEQGFDLELLNVLPIRGGGLSGAFRGVSRAAALLPESRALIRKYQPKAVFSIGGYAAGPVSMAARTLGLPLALMEPNSVIGLANWLIAPFVQRAYTAFEITEKNFSPNAVLATGVPLRPGFSPRPYRQQVGPLRILVLGGSQGAKSLNEVLPTALSRLKDSVRVTHQCGKAHLEAVEERYRELGGDFAEVTPFIDDMPSAIGAADLVVGRSGASAVSEIVAVGRPSLLIPYPYASGDHQRINAISLQDAGAALCVVNEEATAEKMTAEIARFVQDRQLLVSMAKAAKHMGRPEAADAIARDFLRLAGLGQEPRTATPPGAPPTGGEQAVRMPFSEVHS